MSEYKRKVQDIILKDDYPCVFREKNDCKIGTFPGEYICKASSDYIHNQVSFSDCKYCHLRKKLRYLAESVEYYRNREMSGKYVHGNATITPILKEEPNP